MDSLDNKQKGPIEKFVNRLTPSVDDPYGLDQKHNLIRHFFGLYGNNKKEFTELFNVFNVRKFLFEVKTET